MSIGTSDGEYYPSSLEHVLTQMSSTETSGQNPIEQGRVDRNKAYEQFRDENDLISVPNPIDVRSKVKIAQAGPFNKDTTPMPDNRPDVYLDESGQERSRKNDSVLEQFSPFVDKMAKGLSQSDVDLINKYHGFESTHGKWTDDDQKRIQPLLEAVEGQVKHLPNTESTFAPNGQETIEFKNWDSLLMDKVMKHYQTINPGKRSEADLPENAQTTAADVGSSTLQAILDSFTNPDTKQPTPTKMAQAGFSAVLPSVEEMQKPYEGKPYGFSDEVWFANRLNQSRQEEFAKTPMGKFMDMLSMGLSAIGPGRNPGPALRSGSKVETSLRYGEGNTGPLSNVESARFPRNDNTNLGEREFRMAKTTVTQLIDENLTSKIDFVHDDALEAFIRDKTNLFLDDKGKFNLDPKTYVDKVGEIKRDLAAMEDKFAKDRKPDLSGQNLSSEDKARGDKMFSFLRVASENNLPIHSPKVTDTLSKINPPAFKRMSQFENEMKNKYNEFEGQDFVTKLNSDEISRYRQLYDQAKRTPLTPAAQQNTYLIKNAKDRAGKESNDNPEPGTPLHNPKNPFTDENPPQEPQGRPIPGEQARTQEAQRAANDRNYEMGKNTERVNVGQNKGVLNDNRKDVLDMLGKGHKPSDIAKRFDITPLAVRNWIKRNGDMNDLKEVLDKIRNNKDE